MSANEVIRNKRIELGMTMKELADKIGVSEAAVSRWESGDIVNIRRDKIEKLSKALDVPPAVLMGWETKVSSKKDDGYYMDPDTAALAQQIYEDKELRALFDAARDADPEALQAAQAMLKVLKRKERGS